MIEVSPPPLLPDTLLYNNPVHCIHHSTEKRRRKKPIITIQLGGNENDDGGTFVTISVAASYRV